MYKKIICNYCNFCPFLFLLITSLLLLRSFLNDLINSLFSKEVLFVYIKLYFFTIHDYTRKNIIMNFQFICIYIYKVRTKNEIANQHFKIAINKKNKNFHKLTFLGYYFDVNFQQEIFTFFVFVFYNIIFQKIK